MVMWGFIALIIIISIALGVSLHDAFWGIIAFCAGIVVFFILASIFGFGIFAGVEQIKKRNTPQAREARKIKRKQAIADELAGGVVALWIFSPFLCGVLLSLLADSIDQNNQPLKTIVSSLVFIVPLLIFFGGIIWLAKFARKASDKKRTKSS